MPTFEHGEAEVKTQFLRECGAQYRAVVDHFNAQYELWRLWHAVEKGTWVEVGLALWARSFNSMWGALQLAIRGYPVQAVTLLRQAMEDWLTTAYLERHPKEVEKFYEADAHHTPFQTMADAIDEETGVVD